MIIIKRRTRLGRFDKIKIFCDDVYVGFVKHEGVLSFDVPAGKHSIILKVQFLSSNALILDYQKNDITIICTNEVERGWRQAIWILYLTVFRKKVFKLTLIENDKTIY